MKICILGDTTGNIDEGMKKKRNSLLTIPLLNETTSSPCQKGENLEVLLILQNLL